MNEQNLVEKLKSIKDLSDAQADLKKLDEILNDVGKFRILSNKVYHEIADNPIYIPYIAIERAKHKFPYGDIPFENISQYMTRRKIISLLREAVIRYIGVEVEKERKNLNER